MRGHEERIVGGSLRPAYKTDNTRRVAVPGAALDKGRGHLTAAQQPTAAQIHLPTASQQHKLRTSQLTAHSMGKFTSHCSTTAENSQFQNKTADEMAPTLHLSFRLRKHPPTGI